jgi:hypothetical protein
MIVFASTLRTARRPRRIPSVASLVRVLGTVRVTDQPVGWTTTCRTPSATRPTYGSVTYLHDRRHPTGAASRSS